MSSPNVSVIVPNYNHAAYLDQRLTSILEQEYQDFELIFLDDASPDDSREMFLERYAGDARVSYHFNDVNSGSPFRQWNLGVSRARGRLVWIAESDDYADTRLLGSLVGRLEADDTIGVAYTQSLQVDPQGNTLRSGDTWTADLDPNRWSSDFTADGTEECRRYLAIKNTLPNASAVVFRRSVYEQIGCAPVDFRLVGDWATWIRMLLVSNLAFVAQPLNCFRVHPQSVRRGSVLDGTWSLENYRVLSELAQRVDLDPTTRERAARYAMAKWVASSTMPGSEMTSERHNALYDVARQVDPKLFRSALRLVRPSRLWRYVRFLRKLRRLTRS